MDNTQMCALESIHRLASVISSAFPPGNVKLKKIQNSQYCSQKISQYLVRHFAKFLQLAIIFYVNIHKALYCYARLIFVYFILLLLSLSPFSLLYALSLLIIIKLKKKKKEEI